MTLQSRCVAMTLAACAASTASFGGTIITGTDAGVVTQVKAFSTPTLTNTANFFAYSGFSGGVRVAAGDLNGDGLADIVTGVGPGAGPHIKVFNRVGLGEIRSFFAYDPAFTGGVFVAAGDVTGDGRADIYTGTASTSSHVKVFDGATQQEVRSFFAFPGFSGGVRVAAGDVNGDGRADIVAGTGPGAAELRVFDAVTGTTVRDFLPYAGFTGGIFVAAGDVNGDGLADLVTSTDDTGGAASSHVKVFDGATNELIQSFTPFAGFTGSVRVAVGDIDGDSRAEIITGTGEGAAHAKTFDGITGTLINSFIPYADFTGGIFVAGETPVPEPGTSVLILSSFAMMLRRIRPKPTAAR